MSGEQPPIPPIVDLRRWREMRSRRNRKAAPPRPPGRKPAPPRRSPLAVPPKGPPAPFGGRYRMLVLLGASFLLILAAIILYLFLAGLLSG